MEGSLEGRLVLGLELLGEEVTGYSDIGALVGSSEGVKVKPETWAEINIVK